MELLGFSADLLMFLFGVSVVAGCLDTLAGGGGLLSLPALIVSGVPPLAALGTNKLQGSMGTATATIMMLKKKQVRWQDVKLLMLAAFIGSAAGTIAVQFINTAALNFIIPLVLLFIAIYFIASPMAVRSEAAEQKVGDKKYRRLVVPSIGWYDGMFGPGTGSFFALAGVSLRGQGLVESTAVAKTLNFSTNIASLTVFLIVGKVVWAAGLLMMVGQFIGAWVGSHFLVKINPQYLRALVVIMCLSMLAKYAHSMGWFAFV